MADVPTNVARPRFRCRVTEAMLRKLRAASRDISQAPRDQRTARMIAEALGAAYTEVQAEYRSEEDSRQFSTKSGGGS